MSGSTYREYTYDGPVEEFGKCIANRWQATTYAPSMAKARSNLTYQFKKMYNKLPTTKITLPGKLTAVAKKEVV
jgi:hypothetical protein